MVVARGQKRAFRRGPTTTAAMMMMIVVVVAIQVLSLATTSLEQQQQQLRTTTKTKTKTASCRKYLKAKPLLPLLIINTTKGFDLSLIHI